MLACARFTVSPPSSPLRLPFPLSWTSFNIPWLAGIVLCGSGQNHYLQTQAVYEHLMFFSAHTHNGQQVDLAEFYKKKSVLDYKSLTASLRAGLIIKNVVNV